MELGNSAFIEQQQLNSINAYYHEYTEGRREEMTKHVSQLPDANLCLYEFVSDITTQVGKGRACLMILYYNACVDFW